MSQNVISMELDAAQWAVVDGALDTLERTLAGMVSLTPDQRMRMIKMGDKSEAFCRQAVDVMRENPSVLPRNLDMAEVRRDLATHDALRPRLVRLTRLLEKANDTDLAPGSDVMAASLKGYAFLKIAGKGEGLHGLRKVLSQGFDNRRAQGRNNKNACTAAGIVWIEKERPRIAGPFLLGQRPTYTYTT